MGPSKLGSLALCALLLALQACCCMNGPCGAGGGVAVQAQPAAVAAVEEVGLRHRLLCAGHDLETPFNLETKPPGPNLVFGTSDFDGAGAVLIKLQIQDLSTVPGNEATVTAWSGNGDAPTSIASLPAPSQAFYTSNGDVTLQHWTTHLLRDYAPGSNKYWVAVKVDHDKGDGTREVRYLWWPWVPNTTPIPDTPRNFHEYTN